MNIRTKSPLGMYRLLVSAEHMRIIGDALAALPYRVAAPVIAELNRQLEAQMTAPNPVEDQP